MPQKKSTHQRDDDEFLDQLVAQIVHRTQDQLRAIVSGDDFHAGRQALLEHSEFRLYGCDDFQCILPRAHHDHAAHHFTLAVQLRDTAPHLRPELHARHIGQQDRRAAHINAKRNTPKIVQRFQIAARTHHVIGLGQLHQRTTGLAVRGLNRRCHRGQRQTIGAQLVRINLHLKLAHHTAEGGDFRHVRNRFQLELEKPIL